MSPWWSHSSAPPTWAPVPSAAKAQVPGVPSLLGDLQGCEGLQSICIHSLLFCREQPGNWVTGDLKNRGMQSHCFLAKSSIPSEANSQPFNDSPVTARCSDPSMHQDPLLGLLQCRSPAPCPSWVSDSKGQGGPQCFLSSRYTPATLPP